jgi:ribosomal protein S18 acetylase RimI-like enzyme
VSLFAEYRPEDAAPGGAAALPYLIIRAGERDDLAAIAVIAAEREGTDEATQSQGLERFMSRSVEGHGSLLLVAEFDDEIVGFAKCAHFIPPADAPAGCAPEGWYLMGVIVAPRARRRGVGRELTRARLEWIGGRAGEAYYFANSQNQVSIALHNGFGFVEVTRQFWFPGSNFAGGEGILFKVNLKE